MNAGSGKIMLRFLEIEPQSPLNTPASCCGDGLVDGSPRARVTHLLESLHFMQSNIQSSHRTFFKMFQTCQILLTQKRTLPGLALCPRSLAKNSLGFSKSPPLHVNKLLERWYVASYLTNSERFSCAFPLSEAAIMGQSCCFLNLLGQTESYHQWHIN